MPRTAFSGQNMVVTVFNAKRRGKGENATATNATATNAGLALCEIWFVLTSKCSTLHPFTGQNKQHFFPENGMTTKYIFD